MGRKISYPVEPISMVQGEEWGMHECSKRMQVPFSINLPE